MSVLPLFKIQFTRDRLSFLQQSFGETQTLAAHIVHLAVLADPAVAQDPRRSASGARHALEADEATRVVFAQNVHVVLGADRIVLAVHGEDDRRQVHGGFARDDVDLLFLVQFAAQFLRDLLDVLGGAGDQGGASVRDSLSALTALGHDDEFFLLGASAADSHAFKRDLIVGGAAQRDPVDVG